MFLYEQINNKIINYNINISIIYYIFILILFYQEKRETIYLLLLYLLFITQDKVCQVKLKIRTYVNVRDVRRKKVLGKFLKINY